MNKDQQSMVPTTIQEESLDASPSTTAPASRERQRVLLLLCIVAVTGLMAWLQWRKASEATAALASASDTLISMQTDAIRIRELRQAPKLAVGRVRPNEELLATIEQALQAAGIDKTCWHDSIPQPPVRSTGDDYVKMTTRLYFQDMKLADLAALAHQLHKQDSTLTIESLHITPQPGGTANDVDMAVGYAIYAPPRRASDEEP